MSNWLQRTWVLIDDPREQQKVSRTIAGMFGACIRLEIMEYEECMDFLRAYTEKVENEKGN